MTLLIIVLLRDLCCKCPVQVQCYLCCEDSQGVEGLEATQGNKQSQTSKGKQPVQKYNMIQSNVWTYFLIQWLANYFIEVPRCAEHLLPVCHHFAVQIISDQFSWYHHISDAASYHFLYCSKTFPLPGVVYNVQNKYSEEKPLNEKSCPNFLMITV